MNRPFAFATLCVMAAFSAPTDSVLVSRVGNTAFIQLQAGSFRSLDDKQKQLAYWLTQASIAIDPIIYDQLSSFGIREKRLLEEIVARPGGIPPGTFNEIREYALLFWANRGNHNGITSQKFLPKFTFDELKQAAFVSRKNGAFTTPCAGLPSLSTPAQLNEELEGLRASLFDPNYEPMVTAKSPIGGQDIIQASSNTFYQGVTIGS